MAEERMAFTSAIEAINRQNAKLGMEGSKPRILMGLEAEKSVGIQHEFAAFILLQTERFGTALSFRAGSPPNYDAIRAPKSGLVLSKSSNHGPGKSLIPAHKIFTRIDEYRRPIGFHDKDEKRLEEGTQPTTHLRQTFRDLLAMTKRAPEGDLEILEYNKETGDLRFGYQSGLGPRDFAGDFIINLKEAFSMKKPRAYSRPWLEDKRDANQVLADLNEERHQLELPAIDLTDFLSHMDDEFPIYFRRSDNEPREAFKTLSDESGNPLVGDWDLFAVGRPELPPYAAEIYNTFDGKKTQENLRASTEFLFDALKLQAIVRLEKVKRMSDTSRLKMLAQGKVAREKDNATIPRISKRALEDHALNDKNKDLAQALDERPWLINMTQYYKKKKELEILKATILARDEELSALALQRKSLTIDQKKKKEILDETPKENKELVEVLEIEQLEIKNIQDKEKTLEMSNEEDRKKVKSLEDSLPQPPNELDSLAFRSLDPVDQFLLMTDKPEALYTEFALEHAGCISPFEFLQACLLNAAYADPASLYGVQRKTGTKDEDTLGYRNLFYDRNIKNLIQHGAENRNPYAPSSLDGKILHFYNGMIFLTHGEDQLIQFYMADEFLKHNIIDVHYGWKMEKWAPVLEKQAKLGQINLQDINKNRPEVRRTIECYQNYKAIQAMERHRTSPFWPFSLNKQMASRILRHLSFYQNIPNEMTTAVTDFLARAMQSGITENNPQYKFYLSKENFPARLRDYKMPIHQWAKVIEKQLKLKSMDNYVPEVHPDMLKSYSNYRELQKYAKEKELDPPTLAIVYKLIDEQLAFGQASSIPLELMKLYRANMGEKLRTGSITPQWSEQSKLHDELLREQEPKIEFKHREEEVKQKEDFPHRPRT